MHLKLFNRWFKMISNKQTQSHGEHNNHHEIKLNMKNSFNLLWTLLSGWVFSQNYKTDCKITYFQM